MSHKDPETQEKSSRRTCCLCICIFLLIFNLSFTITLLQKVSSLDIQLQSCKEEAAFLREEYRKSNQEMISLKGFISKYEGMKEKFAETWDSIKTKSGKTLQEMEIDRKVREGATQAQEALSSAYLGAKKTIEEMEIEKKLSQAAAKTQQVLSTAYSGAKKTLEEMEIEKTLKMKAEQASKIVGEWWGSLTKKLEEGL